jgi:hypothetical protein
MTSKVRCCQTNQREHSVSAKPMRPAQANWTTLAELREIALASGCTKDQFEQCVRLLGGSPDPIMLALYLRFNDFLPADFKIPSG